MMKNIITGAMIGLGLATGIKAEMYDGHRGPTKSHLDQRLTVKDGAIHFNPIAKYFGDDLFAAAIVPTSDGKVDAFAGAFGWIIDEVLGKHFKSISIIGYGVPIDGSGFALEPTVFLTGEFGRLTIDPRTWVNFFVDSELEYNGLGLGFTLGLGLTDRFRVAADVEKTPSDDKNFKGIVLMVLEPNKQILENFVGNNQIGFRYIYNIGNI